MSTQLTDIWQRTLELLKDELTEVSYETWIKTIEPISINSGTILFGVPADFYKNQLESKYSFLIKNAIKSAAAREYELSFIVSDPGSGKTTVKQNEAANGDDIFPSTLNTKYTFDSFVIGNSNRLAQAAALAVAEAPAKAYNPLFLYGGVGLGKTHLMHAIGNYTISQNPSSKVLYVTSEKFTNELINSIKNYKNEEFRHKYRNIDVLLIDDIQFIAGKEGTQEEFFHTFNALYEAEKQIILSSDKPPRDIKTLEERLRSRFEWGLQADIQLPDLETRIAILKKKAQTDKLDVPDNVMAFIADKIASNIRELEGALIRVIAYSTLTKTQITEELAIEALKDLLSSNVNRVITVSIIQDMVGRFFDIKSDDFRSKRRSRDISYPRQIAMYLCRELTELSLPKIGDEFGGRDHTTVIHAIDKIGEEMSSNSETRRTIEELKRNIIGK